MNGGLVRLPAGAVGPWATAAPRLSDLASVQLRSGPLFAEPGFLTGLHEEHRRLAADESSHDSIAALGSGAACVVTGQQPHLHVGPFYTAWKVYGAIALARRLQELHEVPVVPVFWSGSDDSDFEEVRSAWFFDPVRGPWRLQLPESAWQPGMSVGAIRDSSLLELEGLALERMAGPGVSSLRELRPSPDLHSLAERANAWLLRMFQGTGLVVVDARDKRLSAAARPVLERYAVRRAEVGSAVESRILDRVRAGHGRALDAAALRSGIFANHDGRRQKIPAEDLDNGVASGQVWSPSVLLRPVVQDALLAPVAAVLGPGEIAYHNEIAPVYELLGVHAARPVPRPSLTLVGSGPGWPSGEQDLHRLVQGPAGPLPALAECALEDGHRKAFADFEASLDQAFDRLESRLGAGVGLRVRGRFRRNFEQMLRTEVDRRAGDRASLATRAEWVVHAGVPQERRYSCWMLWSLFADPRKSAFEPLARAWLASVDRGEDARWVLPVEGAL